MRSRTLFFGWVAVLLIGCMALGARAAGTNSLPYAEDFESYTGTNILNATGWSAASSDAASVEAEDYDYPLRRPMPGSAHTKVLQTKDSVTNTMASTDDIVYLDTMMLATPRDEAGDPTVTNDVQVAMYLDTNGYLNVYHSQMDFEGTITNTAWTTLGNDTIATGEWVRLTLGLDYSSDELFSYGYYQIRVDGKDALVGAKAVVDPANLTEETLTNGTWFVMPTSLSDPSGISSMETRGTVHLDDLVLTNADPVAAGAYVITSSVNNVSLGSITKSGELNIPAGDDVTFTVTAASGSSISSVLVDGSPISITNAVLMQHTFINVTASHTIQGVLLGSGPQVELIVSSTSANATGTPTIPSTNDYSSGSTVPASVDNSPFDLGGGAREVCTGWTGTGSVTAGSGTSNSITLTVNSTLTWQWATQYELTTPTVGSGSVTGAGWYDSGSNAALTATASFGYQFDAWSGDTNLTTISGATIDPCPMTLARQITATFSMIPASPGGIPTQYFIDNGLTNYNDLAEAEDDDKDEDGATNGEEYLPGTDPNVQDSVFHVLSVDILDGSNCVTFYGTTNNGPDGPFGILWSTNLMDENGWTLVYPAVDPRATDGTNIWYDDAPGTAQKFYRPYVTNAP